MWYTRFETGQRRVSPRVIERLCNVLRLSRPECDRLMRLAIPEPDGFRAALHESPGLSIGALNSELRKIAAASSIEELCESALRLASSAITGDLFFADRAEIGGSRGVARRGIGAASYEARLEPWHSEVVRWQTTSSGLFVCSDLAALEALNVKSSPEYNAAIVASSAPLFKTLRGCGVLSASSGATSVCLQNLKLRRSMRFRNIVSLVLMPVADGLKTLGQ